MGVPKFYRWISERYPNISQLINDNQIPDFDNFYLDMNGIIHACSHINEDNCEVNVSEEEIFRNIFHYIDFLFRMIRPKKVFFMAVDGVAPRAKMNQQRARRFRAGKDRMKKLEHIARESGRTLNEVVAKHFDTNSITPGTQFMAQLNEQLKYFVHVKITTDPLWENVDIHLSGHLTPGEGEHKIMDYIRYTRSQPGYDINTRHCLYGLDADLIMLGLVTHEMHFALLREAVKFGSKKVSKIPAPEEINWQILHTCLVRDYIDLEFRSIRNKIKFPYDLERIIDDWILMGFLVGNDFIPHLPHFHINEEALSILWDTYKSVLPILDGYMNESGELNLTRFEIYITELAKFEHQRYADENDSFRHLDKFTERNQNSSTTRSEFDKNKDDDNNDDDDFGFGVLDKLKATKPPAPEIQESKKDNPGQATTDEPKSADSVSSPLSSDDNDILSDSDTTSETSNDNEKKSSSTVPKNTIEDEIDKLPLIEAEFRQHKNHYYRDKMEINLTSLSQLQIYVEQYIEALQWILKYYYQGCPSWSWFYPHHYAPYLSDLKNFKDMKISLERGTPFKPYEQLLNEGIFYVKTDDVSIIPRSQNLIVFSGVLPPTSCSLLPAILQPLMTDRESPLLKFYPEDFKLDQNEKKRDWESIVLLPFINEELLLNTITKYYNQLNPNEKLLNQHLPSLCFITTSKLNPIENSLEHNPYFPPLKETRATFREYPIDFYRSDNLNIKYGRFEDKDMIIFPRFPVLNVLPYQYDYKHSAISVFDTRSKGSTLVLNLTHQSDSDCIKYNDEWNPKDENTLPPFQITNQRLLIDRYLGKRVFVNWPHFQYGFVCAITDFQNLYTWENLPDLPNFYFDPTSNDNNQDFRNYTQKPIYVSHHPFELSIDHHQKVVYRVDRLDEYYTRMEYQKALHINRDYNNRKGISIGPIPILLYVSPILGYRTKCFSSSDKCQTMMYFSNQALAYPLQTTLFKLPKYKYDGDQLPQTLNDYFKINDPIFGLRSPYYSFFGHVQQIDKDNQGKYMISCQMKLSNKSDHPDLHQFENKLNSLRLQYYTAQDIAAQLKTAPCVISKITGKVNVMAQNQRRRANPTNVGLSWKHNKPVKELHGYTKKFNDIWYYSTTAISVIAEYMSKFPEIVSEIERKPNKENYLETNIWQDKNGKHEIQQVRIWIKSLPTYSMQMTDATWQLLDTHVVNEIQNMVKSFYAKRQAKTLTEKIKLVRFEPHLLFKSDGLLGMCDPDVKADFMLLDRVVNVRPDTGVPIGARGTIIGIMYGRTNLDTYYEVLFDTLSSNTLDTILLGKNQQTCRIKVRSYHLLNYSHSLRYRSINYQQQQSLPSSYLYEQRSFNQTSTYRQQPAEIVKKDSSNDKTLKTPKSAPASATHHESYFAQVKEQKSTTDDPTLSPLSAEPLTQSSVSNENISSVPSQVKSTLNPNATFTPRSAMAPTGTPMTHFSSNLTADSLIFHPMQNFNQSQNSFQQPTYEMISSTPIQSSNPQTFTQQGWGPMLYPNPVMNEPIGNMSQVPMYGATMAFNQFGPGTYAQPNNPDSQGVYHAYPIGPMINPMPLNYEQQLPMQMQNFSINQGQPQQNPYLSYDPSTLQTQQKNTKY
ncbi:unnamed protein product [Rotaria socialis]|uniref:5'-3' exoribonuclease 1 n=1 Tax=Rotaria socialis TaxID=392032 RepID=A0A820GW63_9BILA|nr:unnamed protein product [Rotaria socialis]